MWIPALLNFPHRIYLKNIILLYRKKPWIYFGMKWLTALLTCWTLVLGQPNDYVSLTLTLIPTEQTLAMSTLISFRLKMHYFCYVYSQHPHYSGVSSSKKWRLLEILLAPFQFENSRVAFQYRQVKTKMFGNDVDTHVHFLIGSYESRLILPGFITLLSRDPFPKENKWH